MLGAALLLALAGTAAPSAGAAPHPPRVERVSTAADGTQADGPSNDAALSADGRHAAFVSTAPSFGCAHFTPCLLVKDLAGAGVTRIDLGSGHTYGSPMPSADGSRIAFSAGTRFLVPYLYDRATGRSERLWPENPPGSNELGRVQSISPDGTHVAYTLGNRNGSENFRLLYVRDTVTGTDELISPAEEGDKPGASVSGDGERVAYSVRSDSEEDPADVFVKDRATGERTQVDTGLGAAFLVRITADGRRVLLEAEGGLYVHDLRTGASRRVAEGTTSSATADGRYAVVSGTDGTRVRDLRTGDLRRIDAADPAAYTGSARLSADGRYLAFGSAAPNTARQVYVRDLRTGRTELVSAAAQGGPSADYAEYPVIDRHGRTVAFGSRGADLVPDDTADTTHVYVRHLR
ncbi:hypothetical protein ACQF36_05390 [Streptomyces sp. Marseille-Q5077]|uniref:hypothetical protein n=1 Tax=Streptomyces sp. Marseille-Q5077 TaxID=3418995 RepID=UPI003CFF54E3